MPGGSGLPLPGSGVNLIAEQGGIGTAETLPLRRGPQRAIDSQASGSVYLIAPTTGLVIPGDITSGGVLVVEGAGQLHVSGLDGFRGAELVIRWKQWRFQQRWPVWAS